MDLTIELDKQLISDGEDAKSSILLSEYCLRHLWASYKPAYSTPQLPIFHGSLKLERVPGLLLANRGTRGNADGDIVRVALEFLVGEIV